MRITKADITCAFMIGYSLLRKTFWSKEYIDHVNELKIYNLLHDEVQRDVLRSTNRLLHKPLWNVFFNNGFFGSKDYIRLAPVSSDWICILIILGPVVQSVISLTSS